jgi:glycosyltransferase involved in cell wall biosynthesis
MSAGESASGPRRWLRAARRRWRPRQPLGAIDWPAPGSEASGVVEVNGWALFPYSPTTRVEVFLDGEPLGRARLGSPRPDIAATWDVAHAGICGFTFSADLTDRERAATAQLLAVATGGGGERLELGPVAFELAPEPAAALSAPAAPTPAAPAAGKRPRVLVYTHQLLIGGAQLYLNDLLRQLQADGLAELTVVSAVDGPLRQPLEELGIEVHVSSPVPEDDLASYLGRVEELEAWAQGRRFEVALVNTATTLTLPGAELAGRLGIPLVWAIHESQRPPVLWSRVHPELRARGEAALAQASSLVFEAAATKLLYEPYARPGSCLTLPYGLDTEPIERARRDFDREAIRAAKGIPADGVAFVCVGTVEPRKAQVLLAQAFGLIAARHPRARLFFVGGRDDEETRTLQRYVAAAGLGEQVEIVAVTPEVQAWYGLADFLVCPSDLESLPRTVLEAMAWETPVLATAVFGLPELISDGETGWLCEPRDLEALAAALDRVLATSDEQRRSVGAAARELVSERHQLGRYGQQIGDLLTRPLS